MKRKYTTEEVNKLMHGRIYVNTNDLNIFVKRKNGLGLLFFGTYSYL